MSKAFSGIFMATPGARNALIELLKAKKIKFNEENMVFVTTDNKSNVIWLEKGDSNSGLQHIIEGHGKDFKNYYGIEENQIPEVLRYIVNTHTPIQTSYKLNEQGKLGVKRIYKYQNKPIIIAIGTNGYIVNAFPIGKEKE